MHNNWVDGTPPAIYIFNDRLEIISTGGLPNNMSKQDFFSGISRPVNITLARIFIQLGLIEQTGHGVLLVTDKYGEAAFEFLDNFLRVTIPFNYFLETNQETNQENLSMEQKILYLIKTNNKITGKEMAKSTGLSESGVKYNLNKMKKSGKIKHIGSTKDGYWEIKE